MLMLAYSFLNDAERIASWNYHPTDDDVIRARLRTLGVQEYKFVLAHGISCAYLRRLRAYSAAGRGAGQEWRTYDVGGTRNSVSHLIYLACDWL